MNARTFVLLKMLVDGQKYTIDELSSEYGVTNRLVRYIIDDCDFYLRSIGLPQIEFTDDGVGLKLDRQQRDLLLEKINNMDVFSYSVSSAERQDYILLSMLCCTEPLKVGFFSQLLNVSKSSIDKDLASLKKKISEYNLDIKTMTGKGIYLSGDELDLRYAFLKVISNYYDFSKAITNYEEEMQSFMERNINVFVFEIYAEKILKIVEDVQLNEKLKLSFLSLKDLYIYLIIMVNRISLNKTIELFDDYIEQMKELKTYSEANRICDRLSKEFSIGISDDERAYVCMMMEGAYYTATEGFATKEWAVIQTLANQLIDSVSQNMDMSLAGDNELINSLTLHLGLSSFKNRNMIPVVNPELENIRNSYPDVFEAIKLSTKQINNDLLEGITDDDIAYLTLHFQAAIERNKGKDKIFNVMVVCAHGYGTASLMKEMITSRFHNIVIRKIITRNYIDNEDLNDIDFIISSVDLDEKRCPIIKVNSILKKQDVAAIEKVMNSISTQRKDNDKLFVDDLISIISNSSVITDKDRLQQELSSYLNTLGIRSFNKNDRSLKDYLDDDTIIIIDEVDDWKQSVKIAGKVLVDDHTIQEEYIDSIIATVDESGPYMVVDNGVALIHGELNRYVNKTGMSMLMIRKGVNFGSRHFDPVHMILCLAATDTYTHNRALNNFLDIINDYRQNKTKYYDKKYIIEKIEEVSKDI